MASKKIRIISLVLVLVVLVTAIPVSAYFFLGKDVSETDSQKKEYVQPPKPTNTKDATTAPAEGVTKEDYKLIAESDTYKMFFYEPRVSILLENKKTGAIMESTLDDAKDDGKSNAAWQGYMKSGVVVTALVGSKNTEQLDLLNDPHTLEITYIDNGFAAKIYFTKFEMGLTVEVKLENDELVVHVPDESMVEYKADNYIGNVTLFPFMGHTYLDEKDGYMFIPDGNGALIYLDDKDGKYVSGFSQMIYGKDAGFRDIVTQTLLWGEYDTVVSENLVLAPIFGMAHTDDKQAYLAVVEDGEKRAYIEAQPNGATVDYNRCFARFVIRSQYIQPLNQSNSGTVAVTETQRVHTDLTVRYILLSGEKANYSGMAVAYRDYLLENGLVTVKDTSFNTRVDFLGVEQEEFLMGTTDVVMTTVPQMREMYDYLQKEGVDSLLTVYKGWQSGGLYALPVSSYKADSSIGGTGALTKLIEESGEEAYKIYLYNDALRMNGRTNMMTFDAMKRVNKRTFTEEVNKQVYDMFYYLLPSKTVQKLEKLVNSYTKKGVNNLAVSGVSNNIFSLSSRGDFYDRAYTADMYAGLLDRVDEKTNLILEQPFAYLWNQTDAFLDMPLDSSQYMYVDEEIPFLSIVLKGVIPMYSDYVNFEADKTEFFLKMVESGVYPSFYLTYENSSGLIYTNSSDLYSTQFDIYKDTVVEYDEKLREVAQKVEGAMILAHTRITKDVVKVTYDNGVMIYVNYSDHAISVEGVDVDAMSYKVGEANE